MQERNFVPVGLLLQVSSKVPGESLLALYTSDTLYYKCTKSSNYPLASLLLGDQEI